MILATKEFYRNKNSIQNNLVSKQKQISLVCQMIKNNIKSYFETGYYKTDINPTLDKFTTFDEIQNYIEALDYTNLLYFYSASIVELVMFNNHLLEKNTEIKEATRNASVIRELLQTKDSTHKLCSNYYINKSDLKNVILTVFCELYTNKEYVTSENNEILKEIVECFENNFESRLTPIDVYIKLYILNEVSQIGNLTQSGVHKLNKQLVSAGGIVQNSKISSSNLNDTLSKMKSVIGDTEIEEHIKIVKQNRELIELIDFVVDVDSSYEEIIYDIDLTSEKDEM